MTWALAIRSALAVSGRWLRAVISRLPQILLAVGVVALLRAGAIWYAEAEAAPLRAEIAGLKAKVSRHEDAARLAAQTAALAVRESMALADAKHREDAHEITRLLERESDLLAAADDARDDLARRLRSRYTAGRAACRRDREGLPAAGRDRQPAPAAAAPGGVVPGARPADPDRFDVAADVALTGEQTAAVARILIAAAREGRCVKIMDTHDPR